jgi:hypothetical protein
MKSNSEKFDEHLDEEARKNSKIPLMQMSKTWHVNWDDWRIWPWNWFSKNDLNNDSKKEKQNVDKT